MRKRRSAGVWILLGGVAALSCSSGGGTPSPGSGGSGGSGTGSAGSGPGGSGVAGSGLTGTGGSSGGGSGGAGGATGGSAAGAGGAGGTTGGSGTGGSAGNGAGGSGGAGGAAAGSGGRGGGAGAGTAGAGGGPAGGGGWGGGTGTAGGGGAAAGGRGGNGGTGGSGGGAANCSGRALSLSANGTASAADTAYSHVEVDLGSDLPIGNSQRTVEFWAFIKTTDWVGEKNEVYYYGTGSDGASFGLDFGTNPVMGMTNNHATLNPFTGSNSFTVDSTADLGISSSTDQWVHVAMVWNGTNVITYVNGLPKITATGTSGATMLATGQSVLTIGCNPSNMNCFNGLFDEFRVWKAARTATEIHDNYNKPVATDSANLVGYWKFDETSGATTADAVTGGGHTAHTGMLKAAAAGQPPTFVVPTTPLPLVCP